MRCLDTYALVEIHNGNPAFAHLLAEDTVITDLTLAEFYGTLYRKLGQKTADYWHKRLGFICKPVPREILVKAVRFQIDNRKQDFSFFDCVGYIYAIENSMRFVTGDKEFKGMKGAEFIS